MSECSFSLLMLNIAVFTFVEDNTVACAGGFGFLNENHIVSHRRYLLHGFYGLATLLTVNSFCASICYASGRNCFDYNLSVCMHI